MRVNRCVTTILTLLIGLSFTSVLNAQTYKIQIDASLTKDTTDGVFANGVFVDDVKSEVKQLRLHYFLRPVSISRGPLGERAFVFKSAFIAGTFGESTTDLDDTETDFRGLSSRFVTQSNLVLEIGYEKTSDKVNEIKQSSVGIGKYLGDTRLAVVSAKILDGVGETKSLNVRYRSLVELAAQSKYLAYGYEFDFIESKDSLESGIFTGNQSASGYKISVNGTYYFSNYLSLGTLLSYSGLGTDNVSSASLNTEYFFTDSIAGTVDFTRSNLPFDAELETYVFGLNMRF